LKLDLGDGVKLIEQVLRLEEGVELLGGLHLQLDGNSGGGGGCILGAMLDDVVLDLLGDGSDLLKHSNAPFNRGLGLIIRGEFYAKIIPLFN